MPERIKEILNKVLDWWKKFNNRQRALLISIVAVVVVALIILATVITKPTMVELVSSTDSAEASKIKGILDDAGISYEVDSDLVFKVNKDDEVDAIMALGDNDIPAQSYDISNVTDGSFSTTEADKQKKYQVYLESKFAEHLSQLDYINSASVDITIPDNDGTILSSDKEGTAAVTLDTKRDITEDQAYAIARYVATELGNESTKNITIINSKAEIIYSGADAETSTGLASSKLSYREKLEAQVKSEIVGALESSGVFSNIEVGMNLDVSFDEVETAEKKYSIPDGADDSLKDSQSIYESEATNGDAAVPGTDSNDNDTTYVTQDSNTSSSSISDIDTDYLNDEKITTTKNNGGVINYDTSSVSVVATRYKVYDQETLEENGTLDDITWEEFKAQNGDPVKVTDVDQDFIDSVEKATGFTSVSFMIYEQPEFIDKDTSSRSLSDILQIVLAVVIFLLLGYVVFRSTRTVKEVEPEPEISVQSLLDSTAEATESLEDIGYTEKSEKRILIEKFVEENPDAVALLLRNWLNEDWE